MCVRSPPAARPRSASTLRVPPWIERPRLITRAMAAASEASVTAMMTSRLVAAVAAKSAEESRCACTDFTVPARESS